MSLVLGAGADAKRFAGRGSVYPGLNHFHSYSRCFDSFMVIRYADALSIMRVYPKTYKPCSYTLHQALGFMRTDEQP